MYRFALVQSYKVSANNMAAEFRFSIQQRTFINYMFIKYSHVKVSEREFH